jgi:TolB protein
MKKKFKVKRSRLGESPEATKLKIFVFISSFLIINFSLLTPSHSKVYIDITSPAFRKLPISISYTGPEEAKEIAGIVENDLDFTGIFYPIDPDILGAEIKVKINVEVSEKIKADAIVFDLVENKEVLIKRYTAPKKILRALAHSISNDIFKVVTGKKGIFRTKLAHTVSSSNKKWLYLTDWDGYNPVRIVSKGLSVSHSWSHDGWYMIYSSERGKRWGIYLLNLRNYRETLLFSSKGLNLVGGVSPDNRIAFSSSKDGSPEIYVMNINGSSSKKITKSFGIDVSPVFSPDGSQIAFVSDRGGSPQIYIMDSAGRKLRRLTFQGSYNTSPVWSPDGKWIAYVGRKNGKNQIFVIKSDSTNLRQLTDKGNNENPTFSPDGMFIAFDSDRDGSKGIYLMSINSERQKRITPKGMKAMNPKWSPILK